MKWEVVIGMETHAQLRTNSKIFSGASINFGAEPNRQACAVDLALPGVLPVLNREAVAHAIRFGLAIGSRVAHESVFARKNYFYPDLPKGYQITQDKTPICVGGSLVVHLKEGDKKMEFHHIHLEEDAGKSLHEGDNPFSFIDYNRAGTPLIEMVTEPSIHSSEEAFALVSEVRKLVRYLGICDGNMEEGSLRADVNVSIRPVGTKTLGTKVEIKNMNSLRNIQRAIEHEIVRQTKVLNEGGTLIQETRTFDAHTGTTHSMRVKETMNDYRYFPEPDLAPLEIPETWLQEIKAAMPLLPWEQEQKLINEFGLPAYDAHFLSDTREMAVYFEEVAAHSKAYKSISNWLMGPVKSHLNEKNQGITDFELSPKALAEIVELVEQGTLTHNLAAHQLFPLAIQNPTKKLAILIEEQGWLQAQSGDELIQWVQEAIAAYPDKVKEYQKGKKGLIALFIGEVMKKSRGTADPKRVNQLVSEELSIA